MTSYDVSRIIKEVLGQRNTNKEKTCEEQLIADRRVKANNDFHDWLFNVVEKG